jgi:diaminopimelate decarboxylase
MNRTLPDVTHYDLAGLVREFGSPLYLYDFTHLREVYQRFREPLHAAIEVYYAVKANPNPAIIKQFMELGSGFDLSSVGEMRVVIQQGGEPSRMSLAGPAKTDEILREALEAQIGMLSIESLSELRSLMALAQERQHHTGVTLRINPAQLTQGFSMKMGGVASPFGIDETQLPEAVELVRQSPWVTISGLHVFAGTRSLDAAAIVQNVRHIVRLADHCSATYGLKLDRINLGGGLGVPYHQGEPELDEPQVIAGINAAVEDYLQRWPDTQFVMELGRYLVASAGMYVATVVRLKQSHGVTFAVLDGGMHHYLAASGNLGQVFRKNFPVCHGTKPQVPGDLHTYHLVGPLCTPIDRMASNVELPPLDEGDLLVFPLAGAYAYTASPLQFLGHPAPAEVAVCGAEVVKIRERIEHWTPLQPTCELAG